MDWGHAWRLVEALSEALYDPLVFWGVPFVLAALAEGRAAFRGHARR